MKQGIFVTIGGMKEALRARHADLNDDGSVRFEGGSPVVFLGIMADSNEAIVTDDILYFVDGEPHKLIDAFNVDPVNRFGVIS